MKITRWKIFATNNSCWKWFLIEIDMLDALFPRDGIWFIKNTFLFGPVNMVWGSCWWSVTRSLQEAVTQHSLRWYIKRDLFVFERNHLPSSPDEKYVFDETLLSIYEIAFEIVLNRCWLEWLVSNFECLFKRELNWDEASRPFLLPAPFCEYQTMHKMRNIK